MPAVAAIPRPITVTPDSATVVETDLGSLVVTAAGDRITGVSAPGTPVAEAMRMLAAGVPTAAPDGLLAEAARQLRAYARGDRRTFDLPLALPDSSLRPFWDACRRIPCGHTISYGELAAWAERPGQARAAGSAMASNPIAVVIPCHRVVDSTGHLHGYGGGLDAKRALLRLEGVLVDDASGLPGWLAARHPAAAQAVVAVRSTRVYCRAACAAGGRLDLRHRALASFASPAEARAAGYRPCRLCRPDEAHLFPPDAPV